MEYYTFGKDNFCIQKVMPLASSDDAMSNVGKKISRHIGIRYVILLIERKMYQKVSPPASSDDAHGVRSGAQTKR